MADEGEVKTRFGGQAEGEADVLPDVFSMCLAAADLVHGSCPLLAFSRLTMVRFG